MINVAAVVVAIVETNEALRSSSQRVTIISFVDETFIHFRMILHVNGVRLFLINACSRPFVSA